MKAPDVEVLLSTDERRPLATFYENRSVALLFLRHLGCLFCRQQVSEVRTHADLNVLYVGMATPREAREFADEYGVTHPIACDPDRRLYRMFNLSDGNLYQILSPRVMARAVAALRQGHAQSRPPRHPKQLAGAFVVAEDATVIWEYRATDIADIPSISSIASQLTRKFKS